MRGYIAVDEEVLDPKEQCHGHGDKKEFFLVAQEVPDDHPLSGLPLHGLNQWPSEDLLPTFRETLEKYFRTCDRVCRRLLRIMALALGMPAEHFHQQGMFDHAMSTLRLIRYPQQPSDPGRGIFGAGAHTDYGCFTLLATGGPGLQICKDPTLQPQKWEDVVELGGAYVVNIGNMMERWTNGRWKSTMHRVLIPPGQEEDRFSIPFFLDPNFSCLVEVLPTCISATSPARWPPTRYGDHVRSMYGKTVPSYDEQSLAA